MTEITKSITYLNEYKSLKKAIDDGKTPVLTVGLSAIHKANLAAALGADTARPVLVLTDDDNAANRFAADLRGFSEREVVVLPPRELVMADVAACRAATSRRVWLRWTRFRARALRSRPCRRRRSAPCRPRCSLPPS